MIKVAGLVVGALCMAAGLLLIHAGLPDSVPRPVLSVNVQHASTHPTPPRR